MTDTENSGNTLRATSQLTRREPAHGRLLVFVLAGLATTYTVLESMLGPAVPIIQAAFDATPAEAAWVFTGLALAGVVSTPLVTRLADVRNKRRLLLWVWAITALGVFIAGVAPSIGVLALGQVLQGVGLTTIPLSISIFRAMLPAERLRRANGIMVGATSVGSAVGFMLAGPITAVLDFRWLYWLPLVVLVALIAAAARIVPSLPATTHRSVDVFGAVLLGVSLTTLLIGLTLAPAAGWTSAPFLGLVMIAAVVFVAFVLWERRVVDPIIDLRVGGRVVVIVCVIAFAVGYANMTLFLALPMIAMAPTATGYGLGGDPLLAGLLLLPMGVVGSITAIATRAVRERIGSIATMTLSGVLLVACLVLLALGPSVPLMLSASALMGAGLGLGLTESLNLVSERVPADRVASATGLVYIVRNTGSTLGAQIGGSLLASSLLPGIGAPTWSAIAVMYAAAAGIACIAAVGALAIPRRTRAEAEAAAGTLLAGRDGRSQP